MKNYLAFLLITFASVSGAWAGNGGDENPSIPIRCENFRSCSVDNQCPNEARAACTVITQCVTPICISKVRACLAECGTPDCNILESYPLQISCN